MAQTHLKTLSVVVSDLAGESIHLDMAVDQTVSDVRAAVAARRTLKFGTFHLIVESAVQKDGTTLATLAPAGDDPLQMQLIEFDPMLDLGKFDASHHAGIEVSNAASPGEASSLVKTSQFPDSNNVLLTGRITQACFVEFETTRCLDEMCFGVTHHPEEVEATQGFANMRSNCVWSYSKQGGHMPILLFGGKRPAVDGTQGFLAGDRVMVFVDPDKRQVKFYRNGQLVADNLPEHPLPEGDYDLCPFRIYAMVDYQGDAVRILRFGPASLMMNTEGADGCTDSPETESAHLERQGDSVSGWTRCVSGLQKKLRTMRT